MLANHFLSSLSDRPLDIISMGRVAVDLYAEQMHIPLANVESFRRYLGGCAGNIAVGCARLGLRSSMFSCVGTDAMGEFLKQELRREGVDTRLLQETNDALTGLVLLGIQPPDTFPLIFYRQNCADMQLQPTHISEPIFSQTKTLLITGTGLSTAEMRKTTFAAIDCARKVKSKIIFDCDYRPVLWGLTQCGDGETRYIDSKTVSMHYQTLLPHVDLIVGTEEEIYITGQADDLQQALLNIRKHCAATIIVKTGARGCQIYLEDTSQPLIVPGFPVTILNVLGAGDAFMSGLLYGLVQGADWSTCGRYANACGAIVVTRHGCAPAMPHLTEMNQFIADYKEADVRLYHT